MGPPSKAGTCWTEAATNVPTSSTIRTEILIACFIGFVSYFRVESPWKETLSRSRIIGHMSSCVCNNFHTKCDSLAPTSRNSSSYQKIPLPL